MRNNMILKWIILVVALICSFFGGKGWAAPCAELVETTHDFGVVFEDQSLTHTFMIKNSGDAPLMIKDIDPDCACTAGDYDRLIPPGGQGRITLTIAPYSVLRRFAKHTKVFFNDPERREVVLSLKGIARPFIEIQPSHIIRLRGSCEEELQGQVRFISHLPAPFEITGYKTDIPQFIDVQVKAEELGRIYVVEVRNKSRQAGRYAGTIELATTAAKRPRLIMRVFAELSGPTQDTPL